MKKYLEAGKIINTHGVRGEVKIFSYCDSPKILARLKKLYTAEPAGGYRCLEINRASVFGSDIVIASVKGATTLEDAVKLKNTVVFADREDMPSPEEGVCYVADLIGLTVYDAASAEVYGVVTGVTNHGAQDLLEVETPDKKTALIPNIKQFVDRIEYDRGVYITPIEGLFD